MKTCAHCGAADLPEKAKVCGHCGRRLAEVQHPSPDEMQQRTTSPSPSEEDRSRIGPKRSVADAVGDALRTVRFWSALALIWVLSFGGLGWFTFRNVMLAYSSITEEDPPNLGHLLGIRYYNYWLRIVAMVFVMVCLGVLALASEFTRSRSWRNFAYRLAGGTTLLIVALHLYQMLSGRYLEIRFSEPSRWEISVAFPRNAGPWVTAALAFGLLVPEKFFRGSTDRRQQPLLPNLSARVDADV